MTFAQSTRTHLHRVHSPFAVSPVRRAGGGEFAGTNSRASGRTNMSAIPLFLKGVKRSEQTFRDKNNTPFSRSILFFIVPVFVTRSRQNSPR